jgi:hypothetical protein
MALNDNAALNILVDTGIAKDTTIQDILTQDILANWTNTIGNELVLVYADGTLGRIITQKIYKEGVTTILTKTYTYNTNDEVTNIVAS